MDTTNIKLRLAFVGDIALGNHPKTPGFGFYSRYGMGIPRDLAERILPQGISSDIVFGNLEFVLAEDKMHPGTDSCCVGAASYISFLRRSGFTVLNVANNHSWEHGADLFRETVRSLQNAGIKVVGIPDDFHPDGFLRVKAKTVAILGCSARPRQGFATTPDYNEFDKAQFLERIRDARRQADLVCVSIHWGEEFLTIPSPWEREIAHSMVEAGASVIVGHHPHVLREVESFREGVIAYSLGNFIGDMVWNPLTQETGCLVVEAERSRIQAATFYPAVIDHDYFPRYLNEAESQEFLKAQMARHACLNMGLEASGYEFLVRKALKRHQWLTLGFVMKNLFKYRALPLGKIVSHGISVRLQRRNR